MTLTQPKNERLVRAAGVCMLLAATGTACQLILPADEPQCTSDADCPVRRGYGCDRGLCTRKLKPEGESDGGTPDADAAVDDPVWGCLGRERWAPLGSGTVTRRFSFIELLSRNPIPRVAIRPCNRLDPLCTAAAESYLSDDAGLALVAMPEGFDGFFEVRPPDGGGYFPGIAYVLPPPPPGSSDEPDATPRPGASARIPGEIQLQSLTAIIGRTIDPEAGHLLAQALDCRGQPVANVSFTLQGSDAGALTSFYVLNGQPDITITKTDTSGDFGALNIAPGPYRVELTLQPEGKRIGSIPILIRKRWATLLGAVPTP